jgi:hypothetical protein
MKHAQDPPRLADTPVSWSVLGEGIAAARERGPSEAQMRALREGVFASIGITAIAASSSLAGGVAKAGVGIAGQGWWTAVATKVALAVVVGGAATGGTVAAWRRHARPPVDVRAVRPAMGPTAHRGPLAASPATTSPGGAQLPAPPPVAGPLAGLPVSPTTGPRGNVPLPSRHQGGPTSAFSAELQLLARARAALASDPAAALSLTSRHGRLFPGGLLEQERDVLIIEALVRLDRGDQAADKARRFWRRYPQSPYADKVRRTLSDAFPNGQTFDHK